MCVSGTAVMIMCGDCDLNHYPSFVVQLPLREHRNGILRAAFDDRRVLEVAIRLMQLN